MGDKSKIIRKTDEASKQFIMSLLEGSETHGLDIDCLYFTKDPGWIIIEFLKCDTVDPYKSHPNRYPFNWKKFATLFELSRHLKGELWLVNYSNVTEWKDNIRVLLVKGINYDMVKGKSWETLKYFKPYLDSKETRMTLDEFKDMFKKLNRDALAPWE